MVEQEIATLQLATLDELTMISNRRGFRSMAQYSLNVCHRHKSSATLIFFDLDEFKPINDTFGHAEGDRALCAFANLLRQEFRDSDLFARLGGDEFVVLLTGTNEGEIDTVLRRFGQALSDYNETARRGYNLEFSVGHATIPPGEKCSVADLLESADRYMYESKRTGDRSAGRQQNAYS
jgi:diguanylate cyclase (GGDEF)-like protein